MFLSGYVDRLGPHSGTDPGGKRIGAVIAATG